MINLPVPAFVVGGGLNALGVVRSLAKAAIPVTLVECSRRRPAVWSRYCSFARVPGLHGAALIDGLKALARPGEPRPVLILNGDREVDAVSEARSEIEPFYRISLPEAPMVRALADKTLFQAFAERTGLPVPRAAVVNSAADLEALGRLTPPLVLKPASKALVVRGVVERIVVARTADEARRAAQRMLAAGASLIAQEWIDGDDSDIYFSLFACDEKSRPLALFFGRKLVCEPPDVGSTALCVEAAPDGPELESLTRRFLEVTGYRGLGGLEFKRDRRSGRYVIVEPTVGRTDWQTEIACLCGVNLPLAAYRSELGTASANSASTVSSARAASQVAWRASVLSRSTWRRVTPGVRVCDATFRLTDPLPGFYHYLVDEVGHRVARILSKLIRLPMSIARSPSAPPA
jgi:predicted ATP-grasp superfamily ATP-dependent carboligase